MSEKGSDSAISIAERLSKLRLAHQDIDRRIQALTAQGGMDLELMSLKRQKLRLKDEIERLVDSSLPDIIA